eukprot:5114040-Pyramimonas_sp.AAC.1
MRSCPLPANQSRRPTSRIPWGHKSTFDFSLCPPAPLFPVPALAPCAWAPVLPLSSPSSSLRLPPP